LAKKKSAAGFVRAAPATPGAIPALIGPLSPTKPDSNSPRRPWLSAQGWLTALVCAGAALVYISLALQSLVVFLIGELTCVALAPFVLWGERHNIRTWFVSRHRCPSCGFDLREVKGRCPRCGRERFVD
jgi:drug/metabolite transporter (DMT)-like permease